MEMNVVNTTEPPMQWREIWLAALFRPSVATFEQIAGTYAQMVQGKLESRQTFLQVVRDTEPTDVIQRIARLYLNQLTKMVTKNPVEIAKGRVEDDAVQRTLILCFAGALTTMFIALAVHFGLGLPYPNNSLLLANWRRTDGVESTFAEMAIGAIVLAGLWAGVSTQGLVVITAIRHLFARIIGYRGDADRYKLRFVSMAYFAPVAILTGVLRTLPFIGIYMLALRAVYGAIVSTITIKATYQFDWGRAILSNWLSIAGAGIVVILSSPLGEIVWAFVGYALRTGLRR